jgi:hypothetical protein
LQSQTSPAPQEKSIQDSIQKRRRDALPPTAKRSGANFDIIMNGDPTRLAVFSWNHGITAEKIAPHGPGLPLAST